jgi:hypothetical protein
VQDRIDGGITLTLRCPGWETADDLTVENVSVDVYITPRELVEGGPKMSEKVALMAQEFGKAFALPHLRRFATRCDIEGIKAPPLTCRLISQPQSSYSRFFLQLTVGNSSWTSPLTFHNLRAKEVSTYVVVAGPLRRLRPPMITMIQTLIRNSGGKQT